jgi:hypothetical protein
MFSRLRACWRKIRNRFQEDRQFRVVFTYEYHSMNIILLSITQLISFYESLFGICSECLLRVNSEIVILQIKFSTTQRTQTYLKRHKNGPFFFKFTTIFSKFCITDRFLHCTKPPHPPPASSSNYSSCF